MKTRLGVSVGLMGAGIYLAALFGGYIPVILLAGYVLLVEENEWLRRTAVKAVVLLFSFAFLLTLIGLLPDVLSWIGSFVDLFKGSFEYEVISKIVSIIRKTIGLIETVLFIILGFKSLSQGTVKVPVVDGIVKKYY